MSETSVAAHSRAVIAQGSRSFAAAARLFDARTRDDASKLYAWCRYCDDVVDGQVLGHGMQALDPADGRARLAYLKAHTERALRGDVDGDPAFGALAEVFAAHAVPHAHAFELLRGFEMDVEGRSYATLEDTLDYCYHVAGVVGVVMARVIGVAEEATLDRACDLGLAFQLTNIARDVLEDDAAGRSYLPSDWLAAEAIPQNGIAAPEHRDALFRVVRRLLGEADRYYASARFGIAHLPLRSAWAIATARAVYREIGREVVRRGPTAWDKRVTTSARRKLWLAGRGGAAALHVHAPGRPATASRDGLWTRPRG
jgi:phytoene synthase